MIFPYWPIPTLDPETGASTTIARPMIWVTMHGPTGSELLVGLLDTGADNTIIPLSVALLLGIDCRPCQGPPPLTFGGNPLPMSWGRANFELTAGAESYRCQAQLLFYDFPAVEQGSIVFGHRGFLERFVTTFNAHDQCVELAPADA